jgi:hypothetical protein
VATNNRELVDSAVVDEAWADLQQLPIPSAGNASGHQHTDSSPSSIVEFGGLDEPDDSPSGLAPAINRSSMPPDDSQPRFECTELPATPRLDESTNVLAVERDELRTPSQYTLVFHSADNPFGDDFEEEEVVIDHFVSPDALAQRHRRQVVAATSERLAQQMFRLRQHAAFESSGVRSSDAPGAQDGSDSANDASHPAPDIIPIAERVPAARIDTEPDEERAFKVLPANLNRCDSGSVGGSSPKNYHNLFSQLRRRG